MGVTKLKTYDDVLNLAKQMAGQLMEESARSANWEDILGNDNMAIADFVEKRFVGLEDYMVRLPRRLGVASQRLEHINPEPDNTEALNRKRAAQAFMDAYRQMFEEHLDNKVLNRAFDQVNALLYDKRYIIPQAVRNELRRKNSENARDTARMTEEMLVFDSLFNSFFKDNSISDRTPTDQAEIDAEARVFARIARAMPDGEEFNQFKERRGYVNQRAMVPRPQSVTMVMEPCAVTDVTADNYIEKIRKPKPDRVTREWGVGTFDRMMEGIYTDDDLTRLKNGKASYLSTVFVDGKSVRDWLPRKSRETEKAYEARAKSEIVAYALEGKGKVDICPFERSGNGYTLGNPIPMRVKVNLKEEIPVWKRALRFFHIKSETKKEKAERISLEELGKEERLGAVRQQVRVIQERERHRQMAKGAMEDNINHIEKDDKAYFGFLGDSGEAVWNELKSRLYTKNSAHLLNTMDRSASRGNFVRLFALTRGMSLDEVLSDDPELNDRKRAIGQELVERFALMDEDEYKREHGNEADYSAYLREKRETTFHTMEEIVQAVKRLPYEPMPNMSPQTLAQFYKRNNFIGKGMNDLYQSISDEVKNIDKERFDAVSAEMFSMGEIRHAADFVEAMTSDGYVMSQACREEDMADISKAIGARENMRCFEKDTVTCAFWGQMTEHIGDDWCIRAQMLTDSLKGFCNDMENAQDCGHFLTDGKNPVFTIDRETGLYQVGKAREIAGKMQDESWKNEFEEIDLSVIRSADIGVRMRAQKVTKKEEAQIQERERQRKMMEQTIEKSGQLVERDDGVYFGVMGKNTEERYISMSNLARFEKEKQNDQDTGKEYMMKTLHRMSSRVSIVRAYALTKGMTLDEVLSDNPALDERKAEIGNEFLRKINVMGKEEYKKFHGPDADYEQYVAGKETEMFEMAREIHQKIMDLPYEPLKDMKPETLAAAYEKNIFIRDISQDFFQVFDPMEKNHEEEMDEMSLSERALGEIDCMRKYCNFLASGSYVRPDTQEMKDADKIVEAVNARENMERFMEDTKDFTSCRQISQKISTQWAMAGMMLKADLVNMLTGGDKNNYQDAVNYLATGQGKICYFDKAQGNYIVGRSKDIERIRNEKEMNDGGKVKMGLDELGGKGKKKFFGKTEKKDEKVLVKEEIKLEKRGKAKVGRH